MIEKSSLRILVVDDERPIRRVLGISLGNIYAISEAETGVEALQSVAITTPDLVILDLGLPDMDGMEVIRRLREWTMVPIIVISVRDRQEDKVAALDAGADDYLIKPFGVVELLARIRVALRHSVKPKSEPFYKNGNLTIDLASRQVLVNGQPVPLTPTEYEIMHVLVIHAGKVLTHQQLIRTVWSGDENVDMHLLRVNISNLRKKIEQDPLRPRYIITESGVGYRLHEIET